MRVRLVLVMKSQGMFYQAPPWHGITPAGDSSVAKKASVAFHSLPGGTQRLDGFVQIMSSQIQIDKETRESILSNELLIKLLKLGSHRKSATPWPLAGLLLLVLFYLSAASSPGSIR